MPGYGRCVVPSIERESAVPPYMQLAAILREQITSGELHPGAAVPSLTNLTQQFEVARTTARKAVKLLVADGLVEVTQGWRTTVLKPENWRV